MHITEAVLTEEMKALIPQIAPAVESFYLGGGTGLALQLGHRISVDLDFFSLSGFSQDDLQRSLQPDSIDYIGTNTLHVVKSGVRLTFLTYNVACSYSLLLWKGIAVADARDLIAEKFKTAAQRGAKKDFCDLYAACREIGIRAAADCFHKRFADTGLDPYAVVRSLTWFDDAESDPDLHWLPVPYSVSWEEVKQFYRNNVREFYNALIERE